MDIEMVARSIQIILAPVVMVTACAILLQGLLGRYASINERLRSMALERLKLLNEGSSGDGLQAERLSLIDAQIPILLSHHRRSRDAVVGVYAAALIFIADMFVIAFAASYMSTCIATVALLLFLGGVAALFSGVLLIAMEVRTSQQALQFEVMGVLALKMSDSRTMEGKGMEAAAEIKMRDAGL